MKLGETLSLRIALGSPRRASSLRTGRLSLPFPSCELLPKHTATPGEPSVVHFREFLSMGEKSKALGIGQNLASLLTWFAHPKSGEFTTFLTGLLTG